MEIGMWLVEKVMHLGKRADELLWKPNDGACVFDRILDLYMDVCKLWTIPHDISNNSRPRYAS